MFIIYSIQVLHFNIPSKYPWKCTHKLLNCLYASQYTQLKVSLQVHPCVVLMQAECCICWDCMENTETTSQSAIIAPIKFRLHFDCISYLGNSFTLLKIDKFMHILCVSNRWGIISKHLYNMYKATCINYPWITRL